jgi:hypothetical protein
MWTELAAIAATQGGLFTRQQARDAGYRPPALRQLTRPGGEWVVVRRGVYAERRLWERLGEQRERPLALARAVTLSMHVDHVLSHDSAAHAWGLPLLRPQLPLVHVTRPGVHGSRTEHGVKHHLERKGLDAAYNVGGLEVTGLERTALDVAREHGWLSGVIALDAALGLGGDPVLAEAILASMWSWPGVRQARRAAQASRLGAESALETLGRLMVVELGLPEPIPQFPVSVSRGWPGATCWSVAMSSSSMAAGSTATGREADTRIGRSRTSCGRRRCARPMCAPTGSAYPVTSGTNAGVPGGRPV